MRVVMLQAIANRRAGELVEIDTGSGEWLIERDFAKPADDDQGAERASRARRTEPAKTTPQAPSATPPD